MTRARTRPRTRSQRLNDLACFTGCTLLRKAVTTFVVICLLFVATSGLAAGTDVAAIDRAASILGLAMLAGCGIIYFFVRRQDERGAPFRVSAFCRHDTTEYQRPITVRTR